MFGLFYLFFAFHHCGFSFVYTFTCVPIFFLLRVRLPAPISLPPIRRFMVLNVSFGFYGFPLSVSLVFCSCLLLIIIHILVRFHVYSFSSCSVSSSFSCSFFLLLFYFSSYVFFSYHSPFLSFLVLVLIHLPLLIFFIFLLFFVLFFYSFFFLLSSSSCPIHLSYIPRCPSPYTSCLIPSVHSSFAVWLCYLQSCVSFPSSLFPYFIFPLFLSQPLSSILSLNFSHFSFLASYL